MRKLSAFLILLGLLGSNLKSFAPVIHQPGVRSVTAAAGGGGGNDIAFRAEAHAIGTANGATVTEPAGAASGDVFIAMAACGQGSTSLGIPSGWTSIYSGNASTAFRYNVAWIRRGASAPSLTWTMSTSAYREVYILAYSGVVGTGNPYETSADGGVTTSTATGPDCPSVTTVNANAMVLAIGVDWGGSGTSWTAPTGYTVRSDNTAGNDGVMGEKKVTTAGTVENPAIYTGGGGGSQVFWAATIALQD